MHFCGIIKHTYLKLRVSIILNCSATWTRLARINSKSGSLWPPFSFHVDLEMLADLSKKTLKMALPVDSIIMFPEGTLFQGNDLKFRNKFSKQSIAESLRLWSKVISHFVSKYSFEYFSPHDSKLREDNVSTAMSVSGHISHLPAMNIEQNY